jgi:hypothetical protein
MEYILKEIVQRFSWFEELPQLTRRGVDHSIGRPDPGGNGRSACTAAMRSAMLAGRLITRRQGVGAAVAGRG